MSSPLQAIMAMLQSQKPQPSVVRPDYGLTGAMISPQRSPYERTLAQGEQRSAGDLRDMLADVIMAAGSAAVPATGPQSMARGAGGRRSPRAPSKTSPEGRGQDMWMSSVAGQLQRQGMTFQEAVLKARDMWNEQAQMEAEFLAQRGEQ